MITWNIFSSSQCRRNGKRTITHSQNMELMPSNSSFSPNSILITVSIDLPASAAYPVLYLHPRTYAASSTSYADYEKWCMHERFVRILQPLAAICWIVWRFLHLFHFLNRIKLFRMFVHFDWLLFLLFCSDLYSKFTKASESCSPHHAICTGNINSVASYGGHPTIVLVIH